MLDATVEAYSENAFATLVSEFTPKIYRFLYRMLDSKEDAEDLTQETFIEVYKRLDALRKDVDIAPYLFTIARRKAISRYRWRTVRRILKPLSQTDIDEPVCENANPRERAERNRMEETVNRVLAGLKPEKREVVILRFFEERSYAEIARILGKPEGTVKTIAFRAERELRERMRRLTGADEWRGES